MKDETWPQNSTKKWKIHRSCNGSNKIPNTEHMYPSEVQISQFFPFFLHFLQKSHHVMCVWYNICFAMLTSKLVPVAHCSSSAFPKH